MFVVTSAMHDMFRRITRALPAETFHNETIIDIDIDTCDQESVDVIITCETSVITYRGIPGGMADDYTLREFKDAECEVEQTARQDVDLTKLQWFNMPFIKQHHGMSVADALEIGKLYPFLCDRSCKIGGTSLSYINFTYNGDEYAISSDTGILWGRGHESTVHLRYDNKEYFLTPSEILVHLRKNSPDVDLANALDNVQRRIDHAKALLEMDSLIRGIK